MKTNKKYLLIPAMPTPNGALHLGHIGSQFLKLYILKRNFQILGYKSVYMCGLDVYDNAISVESESSNISESEICSTNYSTIKNDFKVFSIEPDYFINWREPRWGGIWHDTLKKVNHLLTPFKTQVEETIPFQKDTEKPVTGRWLIAECPICKNTIHGFSCDPCSIDFKPTEVINPRSAKGYNLSWRTVSNEFVDIPTSKLTLYHKKLKLSPSILETAKKILSGKSYYSSRWTIFDPFGIPTATQGQVYYNYAFSIVEAVAFGEISKEQLDTPCNAFSPESETNTVVAYGRDCSNVFLANIPTLMLSAKLKPYDYQIISPFYLLKKQKMSTNRKFAIWVSQLKQLDYFNSDALRAFMAHIAIPNSEPNIDISEIREFLLEYDNQVEQPLLLFISKLRSITDKKCAYDLTIINAGIQAYDELKVYLQLTNINLPKAYDLILSWVNKIKNSKLNSTMLKTVGLCLSILCYPMLPRISQKILKAIGCSEPPSIEILYSEQAKLMTDVNAT